MLASLCLSALLIGPCGNRGALYTQELLNREDTDLSAVVVNRRVPDLSDDVDH